MEYSKKVFACVFGLIVTSSLMGVYANNPDTSNYTNKKHERYIVKINDINSNYRNFDNISNIFSKRLGKDNYKLKLLTNNTYSLEINDNTIGLNKSVNHIIDELKLNPTIKYIIKDRVGFFKPVPDPQSEYALVKLLNSKLGLKNLDNKRLDHSVQWDQFQIPEGVFLESTPYAYDGAWAYTGLYENRRDYFPVIVAVLDTGIEYNDNLARNIVKDPNNNEFFGWNFSSNDNDLSDETGGFHGTHVAGTIAAHGTSIMGMGPMLQVLPVKICDATGMFYESNVIKGIYWAIGEPVDGVPINHYPAKVLNMSFGIDEYVGKEVDDCSPAVQEAIDFARDKGVVVIVAAGNSNKDYDLGSPGGCKGAIRVASTGPTGLRSYFSNYGHDISYAAPGGDKRFGQAGAILSTVKAGNGINDSGFDYFQGTSMAAPHVAGLAGLVFSVGDSVNNYTARQVEKILYTTTHDFGKGFEEESSCVGNKSCGHGIINAKNAVETAIANYSNLFSSPSADFLDLQDDSDCRNGMLVPSKDKILKPEGTWVLDETSKICQSSLSYTHPTISYDVVKDLVKASYGRVVYTLDVSKNFSSCQQIGYDGMGCNR